jgi:DNA-binding FadR family transcriptional regulator
MERVGRVSRVEEDLERMMVLGLLPGDGFLPSEQLLARQLGVSRATAREALLRLAARGLVVQHPGRRSRVVPLSEAVTLENLSVMLHGEDRAHPERRRLLEGYFALKREVMVELLAACCEKASQEDLSRLEDACFALQGTAPWEEQRRWAEREFELLRLAALTANRPGYFLLVRSLERSFWAMAGRLLPHLDCTAVRQWSWSAYHALCEKDVQALRRELPVLLQAADDCMIGTLGSEPIEPLHGNADTLELMREKLPVAGAQNQSACHTGLGETPPTKAPAQELEEGERGAIGPNRSACHTGPSQDRPTGAPLPECEAGARGPVWPNRSACHTGSSQMSPTEGPLPAPEVGARSTAGPSRSACPTGSAQMPPMGTLSYASETGVQGVVGSNRSACPASVGTTPLADTLSREFENAPPARDTSHEPGSAGAGNPLSRMMLGAERSPSCDNARGAQMWSPVPWPLAPARAGDGADPLGPLKRASACLEALFDDAQVRQPMLRVTARPGQVCSWAAELHRDEGTRRASWAAVIELRWG